MVTTAHVIALLDAHRERQQSVGAGVVHCHHGAVQFAVQHDWFTADGACHRSAINLMVPAGHIPLISSEHAMTPIWTRVRALSLCLLLPHFHAVTTAGFQASPGSRVPHLAE